MFQKIVRAALAVLFLTFIYPLPAHAHEQYITIAVSRDGFDHMANYEVDVEAGHQVTITFTYSDDDLAMNNRHDIQIVGAGVNLPIVTVDRDHPTATLTFIPPESGRLTIICITPCIGMENLVSGTIRIVEPRESGLSTFLTLELSPRDEVSVFARVKLTAATGDPIAGVPVAFLRHTSVGGELVIGDVLTEDDGTAVLAIPVPVGQTLHISAVFRGGNGLNSTKHMAEITMPGELEAVPIGALSSPTPPLALALILLVVLGGIWTAYGTVAYQVFRIRSGGHK